MNIRDVAYELAGRAVPFRVYEFSVDPHLVNLLQAERVVPEVSFAEAPPVCHHQILELKPDLAEAIVYRLERRRDVLRVLIRLDLVRNLKAFFKQR